MQEVEKKHLTFLDLESLTEQELREIIVRVFQDDKIKVSWSSCGEYEIRKKNV